MFGCGCGGGRGLTGPTKTSCRQCSLTNNPVLCSSIAVSSVVAEQEQEELELEPLLFSPTTPSS